MPCYLFTYHAYGSWMPDREQGFVRRGEGILPANTALAQRYRQRATQAEIHFDDASQKLLIEAVIEGCECRGLRLHFVAAETTHFHVLVSWSTEQAWKTVRTGLKSSLSRRLNRELGRKRWWADGSSRKQVNDQDHFEYLVGTYLPKHKGWKWQEGVGMFR